MERLTAEDIIKNINERGQKTIRERIIANWQAGILKYIILTSINS